MKDGNSFTSLRMVLPSRKAIVILLGFFLTFGLLFNVIIPPAATYSGNLTCYAPTTSIPPTIDGILSPGEWSGATHYSIYFVPTSDHPPDYIDVFLLSNATALFVAYDVQPDNTSEVDDYAYIFLDLNNNGTEDLRLAFSRGVGDYAELIDYTSCLNLVWTSAFGFNTTPQETGRDHTIFELMVRINQTDTFTGSNTSTGLPFAHSPVGVLFSGYGTLSPTWYLGNSSAAPSNPQTNSSATTYANLYLGSPPEDGFPGWLIVLAILLPAIGVVTVILILRKKKG
ncbi:MAG: hypothetical protein HWN65_18785 [Candidatus Helarchaeota archaeon]|nr:hypothetical protein [Candidatus Helarchaeota archaeon]